MHSKWHSYIEILYFPLVLLYVACVLRGISGLILDSSFQVQYNITNTYVILFAELFNYAGYYFIQFFPFLILIKLLAKRYNDSVPVFIGVIVYVIFNISTMFFAPENLPSYWYQSELGISIDASSLSLSGSGMRYPLMIGIFSVIISILITKYFYEISRRKKSIGVTGFINKDAYALILASIAAILCGIGISYIWKYADKLLTIIFDFIASDITNPINLFVYGVMEKILSILDLDSIIHSAFWFGERGGSWVNNGVTYLGDVSIWTAQLKAGVYNTGFGRFITPYYVQNFFIIPMTILITYLTFTDKLERKKFTLFLFLSLLLSILCGNSLPFDIYLLVTAPLFFAFHVFMNGVLYAVLHASKIWIGYSFTGKLSMATPGSIFNIQTHIHEGNMGRTIFLLIVVGVILALIYGIVLLFYYFYGSVDILQTGRQKELINSFSNAVGGVDNIIHIYSSPTKIIINVDDASLINFTHLQEIGAYKVVETQTTYEISFGSQSYLIAKEVNKLKKAVK